MSTITLFISVEEIKQSCNAKLRCVRLPVHVSVTCHGYSRRDVTYIICVKSAVKSKPTNQPTNQLQNTNMTTHARSRAHPSSWPYGRLQWPKRPRCRKVYIVIISKTKRDTAMVTTKGEGSHTLSIICRRRRYLPITGNHRKTGIGGGISFRRYCGDINNVYCAVLSEICSYKL